ncbi:MAG: cell division protein SepF [Candidatus Pacearchaeota archaeon]
MVFKFLKRKKDEEENQQEFIEIDSTGTIKESKVLVKTFSIKSYEDINNILNALREGYTIAVIDIKPIRAKDVVELKRAVTKIRKTVEAMEGSIAALGENIVIAAPSFAKIQKGNVQEEPKKESKEKEEI